ncbi:hypothetical protein FIBSPDRAFT_257431 [Athelia psychrophila]|uniref:Uncharacterized protein n=1 Tax=Athelia psychrophila TaxID=1759441 RepID=A0A165XIQ2_9AGAM|nr:hypothetical protein FIBSPDRAFT_257431 [Fibularhizoctonia sp. CBS 109695]
MGDLSNYRHALSAVVLKLIRQYMWSGAGESCAVNRHDSNLRECHNAFASCILALGRAAWPKLDRLPGVHTVHASCRPSNRSGRLKTLTPSGICTELSNR